MHIHPFIVIPARLVMIGDAVVLFGGFRRYVVAKRLFSERDPISGHNLLNFALSDSRNDMPRMNSWTDKYHPSTDVFTEIDEHEYTLRSLAEIQQ